MLKSPMSRRNFMQRRLPDMVEAAVNQQNFRWSQFAAQLAGKFQTSRTASDDYNFAMQMALPLIIDQRNCTKRPEA